MYYFLFYPSYIRVAQMPEYDCQNIIHGYFLFIFVQLFH